MREEILPQISWEHWSFRPSGRSANTSSLLVLATTRNSTSESGSNLHFTECETEDDGWKVETIFIVLSEVYFMQSWRDITRFGPVRLNRSRASQPTITVIGALRFVHACMFVTPRYCALVLVKMETHIPMIFLCFKSHRCIIFHRFSNIPDFLISQSP